jgi:nucleoside diphosphate kinase
MQTIDLRLALLLVGEMEQRYTIHQQKQFVLSIVESMQNAIFYQQTTSTDRLEAPTRRFPD